MEHSLGRRATTVALMGVLVLGPCDPPASPITCDAQ